MPFSLSFLLNFLITWDNTSLLLPCDLSGNSASLRVPVLIELPAFLVFVTENRIPVCEIKESTVVKNQQLIILIFVVFDCQLNLQPPAHAGSSLADFSTLKMEAIRSSETSVHTRTKWCHIPENGILHSHRRENLKSYILVLPVIIESY
jgi:hypothetical protein